MKNQTQRNRYSATRSLMLCTDYTVKSLTTSTSSYLVELINKPLFFPGYIHGFRQPSCLVHLLVKEVSTHTRKNLSQALKHYFADNAVCLRKIDSKYDVANCFGEALLNFQKIAGLPVFETFRVKSTPQHPDEFQIAIPFAEIHFMPFLIDFMIDFLNRNAMSVSQLPDMVLKTHISGLITKMQGYAPKGSNSLRFLQAAHDARIPWMFIAKNTYQFGYGIKSRWLDSSFSDNTSQIATELARNKVYTAQLLSKAGLPVPEQYLINNEDEALSFAKKIGYPVVIKPFNEDGGKAVFAKINSDKTLKEAYKQARIFSNPVLLEKQIEGKDYRLQVVNNELIWAIERIPARILGDGVKNIRTLVNEQKNQLTETTIQFIIEQGFTLDTIPPSGEYVYLNRIANISADGIPVAVFDKVHPDNKRLAETAANLLRLDIAGIDLIMPDIQHSWLETNGVIIEVNAQPQLGVITAAHIYKEILNKLMPAAGRIPIIVIFGTYSANFIENITSLLSPFYKNVGVAASNFAYINGTPITKTTSLFLSGRSLLFNKMIDALIYPISNIDDLNNTGLPFDAFDYLFCIDKKLWSNSNYWTNYLMSICLNTVITTEDIYELVSASIESTSTSVLKAAISLNQKKPVELIYPDWVNTISYVNEHHQVVIEQMQKGVLQSSTIENSDPGLPNQEKLLLALGHKIICSNDTVENRV